VANSGCGWRTTCTSQRMALSFSQRRLRLWSIRLRNRKVRR